MHITIKGADNAPRWDTIQLLMRELTGDPLLQLTRIAQFDTKLEGQWELDFRDHNDQLVRANLTLDK